MNAMSDSHVSVTMLRMISLEKFFLLVCLALLGIHVKIQ